MSTIHRHSLKKAHQSHRMKSPPTAPTERKPSFRSTARSARRLWRSRWFWPGVVIILVLIGTGFWYYGVRGASNSTVTSATTSHAQSSSTATTNWQTVRTLSGPGTGNATKKTETFTVSSNWQISWSCQGTNGVNDWLYIAIYNPDGTLYNAGAQVTCIAAKQVVGSVQETKAGKFYLTVDANTDWTITIQQARQ